MGNSSLRDRREIFAAHELAKVTEKVFYSVLWRRNELGAKRRILPPDEPVLRFANLAGPLRIGGITK